MSTQRRRGEDPHTFGGSWTTAKLKALANYLSAYTTALKNQPFQRWYIDAFAGTGSRQGSRSEIPQGESGELPLLVPTPDQAPALLDGSVRIALKTTPPFDRYVFIDSRADHCRELEKLKLEFPHLAEAIQVRHGDANQVLQNLPRWNSDANRAVLFLDPYGMQVEWKTIEAIARTKAIDLWVLIPLAVGPSRLLVRSGHIPAEWKERLSLFLGTDDWFDALYDVKIEKDLFGTEEERVTRATVSVLGKYLNDRLKSVFADVLEPPGVLRNSTNSPLYLLSFAVANPRGAKLALKLARSAMKDLY